MGRAGLSATGKAVLAVGVAVVAGLVAVAIVGGLSTAHGPRSKESGALPGRTGGGGPAPTSVAAASSTTSTTTRAQAEEHLLSLVELSPPDGARNQSPLTVVRVRANGARLVRVDVEASPTGTSLLGRFIPTGDEWRSTGSLLPGATYTVTYQVAGFGLNATGSAIFRTSPPALPVTASVFPSPGIVVGVGQPVVIMFSQPVGTYAAQQAVLSHLRISMSKPVAGGWHWFSSVELHFRPSSLWPVGEEVSVTGDIDGWHIGGGEWGEGQFATDFVVGDSHISYVNLTTHEMTVTDNGRVVYVWPISAGAPQWPTMDGTHIVLDRESVVHMVSSTVGIPVNSAAGYDEYVYWDVHISDSGEYVHAAPWSVTDQGIVNVSHGCVNLSVARAETFFRFSRVGDLVIIQGGPRPPAQGDHGVMDWSFPTSEVIWTPARATLLDSPVTIIPTTTLPPPAGAPSFPTTLPPAGGPSPETGTAPVVTATTTAPVAPATSAPGTTETTASTPPSSTATTAAQRRASTTAPAPVTSTTAEPAPVTSSATVPTASSVPAGARTRVEGAPKQTAATVPFTTTTTPPVATTLITAAPRTSGTPATTTAVPRTTTTLATTTTSRPTTTTAAPPTTARPATTTVPTTTAAPTTTAPTTTAPTTTSSSTTTTAAKPSTTVGTTATTTVTSTSPGTSGSSSSTSTTTAL